MTSVVVTTATLDDLAAAANAAHHEAERMAYAALDHARLAGVALLEAKEQVAHGAWGDWLRDNFEGSIRSAQVYMRVALNWPELEAKCAAAAHLNLRQAVGLLEKPRASFPEDDPYGIKVMEEVDALLASLDPDTNTPVFIDTAEALCYWAACYELATRIENQLECIRSEVTP